MEGEWRVCVSFTDALVLFYCYLGEGTGAAVDYCQWETVNISCVGDDVIILVTSARYGRMRVGRCVPVDYFTGCAVDVLPALERRCSGWKHCSVAVSDRQLFRVQPCRKDLVAYLELAYRCVPGTCGFGVDRTTSGKSILTSVGCCRARPKSEKARSRQETQNV